MIEILLKDVLFEQDIRELLMAFYPGEEFIHEPGAKAFLTFWAERLEDHYRAFLRFGDGSKREFTFREHTERIDTKNELKRNLYQILAEETGKSLPWGTLTGIRPTKIAMKMLEEGKSEEEVKRHLQEVYLVSDEKTKLCILTAKREREILDPLDYQNGWSLYIGIPFCPTRCAYCSFTSYPIDRWKNGGADEYLASLKKELVAVAKMMRKRKLQTIYMGGGTPTSLSPEQIDEILCCVEREFDLSHLLEITIEAGRPDSITREKLEVMRRHGVQRISINPQTMQQRTLDIIGRRHSVERVREQFFLARQLGFENINMDLIVGLPEENLEDVQDTLAQVMALAPDSVTVHSLAIKRAARLNTNREEFIDLKIENTWQMIEATASACQENQLLPYYLYRQKNMAGNFENVGYAKEGKACIYNILIMEEKQTIVACGAGTSSKIVFPKEDRIERVENVKDPKLYIERLDQLIQRKEQFLLAKSDTDAKIDVYNR